MDILSLVIRLIPYVRTCCLIGFSDEETVLAVGVGA